jgi:hypothetical protein
LSSAIELGAGFGCLILGLAGHFIELLAGFLHGTVDLLAQGLGRTRFFLLLAGGQQGNGGKADGNTGQQFGHLVHVFILSVHV